MLAAVLTRLRARQRFQASTEEDNPSRAEAVHFGWSPFGCGRVVEAALSNELGHRKSVNAAARAIRFWYGIVSPCAVIHANSLPAVRPLAVAFQPVWAVGGLAAAPVDLRVQDVLGLVRDVPPPVSLLARHVLGIVHNSHSLERTVLVGLRWRAHSRSRPNGPEAPRCCVVCRGRGASHVATTSPASAFDSATCVPLAAPMRNASRALEFRRAREREHAGAVHVPCRNLSRRVMLEQGIPVVQLFCGA